MGSAAKSDSVPAQPWSHVLAFGAGGIVAGAMDLVYVNSALFGEGRELGFLGSLYLVSLGAWGGLMLGVPVVAVTGLCVLIGRKRPITIRNPGVILGTLLATAVFCYQNLATFEGPRIREHPLVIPLQIGVFLLGGLTLLLTIRCGARVFVRLRSGSLWLGSTVAILLLGLACGVYWIDATKWVRHYPGIHLQLAATVTILTSLVALGVIIAARSGRLIARGSILLLLLMAISPLARLHSDLPQQRTRITLHATNLRQWMAMPELVLDRIIPLESGVAGDVSSILAARARDARLGTLVEGRLDAMVAGRRDLNLLIVSLDTIRADHVSHNGYKRITTPVMDRLAKRSLVFERCYSQYPTSSYAFSSFFTSRYPSCAPVDWAIRGLPANHADDLTLAGLLSAAGFTTIAESAFNRGTLERRDVFGHLTDGFSIFNQRRTEKARSGPQLTQALLSQLEANRQEKFFIWAHYLDPHEPYERHANFDFGPGIVDRYDSEIAMVDAELGKLLEKVEHLGLTDKTVVVVMSDHGEEFDEHFSRYHNTSLYEEQIRVPLLIHVPGLEPRRIEDVVGLVDVLPTLTRLLGLKDSHTRNGRDLWPVILGVSEHEGYAYAQLHAQRQVLTGGSEMIVHGGYKLIASRGAGTELIYDLAKDPSEQNNLLGSVPDRAAILRGLLDHVRGEIADVRGELEHPVLAPEAVEQTLENLLQGMAAADKPQLKRHFGELVRHLQDPVFGLKRQHRKLLDGPFGAKVVGLLWTAFDGDDPSLGLPALTLANRFEEPAMIPAIKKLSAGHPRVKEELLILRGVLGDRDAAPALKALMSNARVFEKHRVAMALLLLGERVDLSHALAVCRTRYPFIVARIIRGLGKIRAPELLDISELMFTHTYWQYAPLRMSLVESLAALPTSARQQRLLARLSRDYEPAVAQQARTVLATGISEAQAAKLYKAGAAESECDGALYHRKYSTAIEYMRTATTLYPDSDPGPGLKLAHLCNLYSSDPQAGKAVLEGLAARFIEGDSAREISGRLGLYQTGEAIKRGPLSYEILEAEMDESVGPRQVCLLKFRVKNTGAIAWPCHKETGEFVFRPVIRSDTGQEVPISPVWDACVGFDHVAPGETTDLCLIFRAPVAMGRYQIALRSVWILPWGGIREEKDAQLCSQIFEVVRAP